MKIIKDDPRFIPLRPESEFPLLPQSRGSKVRFWAIAFAIMCVVVAKKLYDMGVMQ